MDRLIIEAEMTQLLRWRSELREIFDHRGDKTLSAWLREKQKEVAALEKVPLDREVHLRAAPPKRPFPRLIVSNDD
jgi:hypothetical protein